MKRIMIDTNVYEFILKYIERDILENVLLKKSTIFYGSSIIRKELRDIPKLKREMINGKFKGLRHVLLELYDLIVGKHHYQITKQMEELADKYFTVYKEIGGFASKKDIIDDFKIVACASLNKLDILVTEDTKIMISDNSIKSYKSVNQLLGFKTPKFINFKELKNKLRGGKLD